MDPNSTMGFLDLIVVGSAVYVLYTWAMLMFKNKISTGLMVSKECNTAKCKDLEGFKREIGWKTLLTGLLCLLSGGIGLYQDYVKPLPPAVYWVSFVAFFVVLIWYGVTSKRVEAKYF